jgi:hypothetical protein
MQILAQQQIYLLTQPILSVFSTDSVCCIKKLKVINGQLNLIGKLFSVDNHCTIQPAKGYTKYCNQLLFAPHQPLNAVQTFINN